MTLKFCRTDVLISVVSIAIFLENLLYVLFGLYVVPPNRFHLLFNCQFFFLSVEGSTVNWAVNYFFQLFIVTFEEILFLKSICCLQRRIFEKVFPWRSDATGDGFLLVSLFNDDQRHRKFPSACIFK